MKQENINEEGEPINSVSAGSMDSHDASDGRPCKKGTKCDKLPLQRRKRKKFKEYIESFESIEPDVEGWDEDGWYDLEFDDEIVLRTHINNLEISADDYEIYSDGIAQFRNEKDVDAVERLMYPDGYYDDEL